MLTPTPRGPLSEAVRSALRSGDTAGLADPPGPAAAEDAQLSLWMLYALHHRGFEDVEDALEWDPHAIGLRRRLEEAFEQELRERAPAAPEPGNAAEDLFSLVAGHEGPSLSGHLHREATREQMLQFLRHRSIYTLKESDHTTWTIPRLPNPVKAAVMELQYDEYGAGDPGRLHAQIFARGLAACGLDPAYGAYIDEVPLEVLEQDNVMSLFALNRRLRAASLGFLAAFEATSSAPSRRIARGLERLGLPAEIIDYYTEHVEADAVHEQLAVRSICGALLQEDPALHEDVFLGAWVCLHMDDRYAARMLEEWAA